MLGFSAEKNAINTAPNEKLIVSIAALGMFLSSLDSGIINVALPTLQAYFHDTVTNISWTISLYLIVLSCTIISFGKLSDRFGRVKVFNIGLIIFATSSILCGASTSAHYLIAFRGLQGIGAAMLQATAAALITTLLPSGKRGVALGTMAVALGMGPILGPTIGGFLISALSWRWIFWINIPLCIFGIWGCAQLKDVSTRVNHPIGVLGNLLLSIFMLSIMFVITVWPTTTSREYLFALILVAVIAMVSFLIQQNKSLYPIVSLKLFRDSIFSTALLSTLSFGVATAIILVVPPFFLEKIYHFLPWQVGFISLCAPAGLVLSARVSGKHIESIGMSRLMFAGLSIMVASLCGLSAVASNWSPLLIALFLLIYGLGGGLFLPANMSAIMGAVSSEKQGSIGAVNRMVHNFGNALGVAISAALLQTNESSLIVFRHIWFVALGFVFLSLISFALLEMRNRTRSYIAK